MQKKVPVSRRALEARIRRTLAQDNQTLRANRAPSHGAGDLGDYYVIDMHRNNVVAAHVDIEKLGRELGILKAWEKLAD